MIPGLEELSVLVIDDEERIRHTLSYAFTLSGCHVITASTGSEGIQLARNKSYNIAFIDLKMPGLDGIETARWIKSLSPDTYTILMTGWNIKLDDSSLKNVINAVITKPFQLSEVSKIIKSVIK
jgi:CheY-like chemotaxis protein